LAEAEVAARLPDPGRDVGEELSDDVAQVRLEVARAQT
jgi:hypothetical protein